MTALLAACDSTSWPDVVMFACFFAFVAVIVWLQHGHR